MVCPLIEKYFVLYESKKFTGLNSNHYKFELLLLSHNKLDISALIKVV